jgi:hypothetical protein
VADVLQFYPSIYTHSIPWALHGKTAAKRKRRDWTLVGNRLDFWFRQAQDQQTRGIPIGPDLSRVGAEVILVAVDEALQASMPAVQGFRAVDDYELSFKTRAEAEAALSLLQSALASFELQLNESKTDILELPLALDGTWPAMLRDFSFSDGSPRKRIASLTEYFSTAFALAVKHADESVLKYAMVRAAGCDWSGIPWRTYQQLLLQCATAEPGVFQILISELRKYQRRGEALDQERIAELAELTTKEHLPVAHGSEVVWAVWMMVALGLSFTASMEALISTTDDPLVPLVALHGRERGLAGASLDTSLWEKHMTQEALRGPHWLLAYEAGVRNWLPSQNSKRHHVDQDSSFGYLNTLGVRFYNTRALATAPARWRPRMPLGQLIGYAS